MESKQLLVPRKDMSGHVILRSKVREYFERTYRESERLDLHFVKNKCYVKVATPIPEFSSFGRLQYHDEEKVFEYQIVLGRMAEIMEG